MHPAQERLPGAARLASPLAQPSPAQAGAVPYRVDCVMAAIGAGQDCSPTSLNAAPRLPAGFEDAVGGDEGSAGR